MTELRDMVVAVGILPTAAFVGALLFTLVWWLKRRHLARADGHGTVAEHLRSVPSTDAQRMAAVDMALKGAALCLLGLVFWPFLLAGLTPLYYGVRKILLLGLGVGNDLA